MCVSVCVRACVRAFARARGMFVCVTCLCGVRVFVWCVRVRTFCPILSLQEQLNAIKIENIYRTSTSLTFLFGCIFIDVDNVLKAYVNHHFSLLLISFIR